MLPEVLKSGLRRLGQFRKQPRIDAKINDSVGETLSRYDVIKIGNDIAVVGPQYNQEQVTKIRYTMVTGRSAGETFSAGQSEIGNNHSGVKVIKVKNFRTDPHCKEYLPAIKFYRAGERVKFLKSISAPDSRLARAHKFLQAAYAGASSQIRGASAYTP